MPKYKCKWTDSIKKSHPYLIKGNTESTAFCTICSTTFSIASGGNSDADKHRDSEKHQKNTRAAASSSIRSHFQPTFNSTLAAQEGLWAYHVMNSNHSFASSDCASKIIRECFGIKKFTCSQSKCRAIAVNVLAPHAEEIMADEINKSRFVTLFTDASNHNDIKLFPVMGRYFLPLANITWTASKTNLFVATLRAILMVKCNFRQSCIEFYHYLLKMPKLLQRISSKDKYKIENASDDIGMLTDTSDEEAE